jgi:hypothetical protein
MFSLQNINFSILYSWYASWFGTCPNADIPLCVSWQYLLHRHKKTSVETWVMRTVPGVTQRIQISDGKAAASHSVVRLFYDDLSNDLVLW